MQEAAAILKRIDAGKVSASMSGIEYYAECVNTVPFVGEPGDFDKDMK